MENQSQLTFQKLIGCQWPIAIMAMNKVSDVTLAVAAARAGILPSLSIFNYYISPNEIGLENVRSAIMEYNTLTNNAPLLVSVAVDTIINNDSFQMLVDCKVKVLEILFDAPDEIEITDARIEKRNARIAELKQHGIILFAKALNVMDVEDAKLDGIILKGPDAAGRVIDDGDSLIERIKKCKKVYPQLHIIASGGIGTSAQIQECIDAGAIAVGLGTVFAASEECAISLETKLKMVGATAEDIAKLKNGARQHALIFKEIAADVNNNTRGLMAGIKNPTVGHVFAGKGIEHIKSIRPVQEIVNDLTKDLV
jgi:NAD(P)H-dependent flavin oxidoreductase YrpB (nitropropane dioxygenase family)